MHSLLFLFGDAWVGHVLAWRSGAGWWRVQGVQGAGRDVGLALCLRSRLVLLCVFCLMVYRVGEHESFSIGAECVR